MTHEELRELAPLYALGALDGADLAEFFGHLPGCGECRTLVRGYAEAATVPAFRLPPQTPSTALRSRILQSVQPPATVPVSRWGWLAAAAAVVAVAFGALFVREYQRRMELEALLRDPGASVARLQGEGGVSGRVVWKGDRFAFFSQGLPALPAGKVYELWAIADGKPVSVGVIDSSGDITRLLLLPGAPAKIDAFAVTEEPADGDRKTPTLDRMPLKPAP